MCLIERETKGAREKEGGKEGNKKRIKRGEEKEKCREKKRRYGKISNSSKYAAHENFKL